MTTRNKNWNDVFMGNEDPKDKPPMDFIQKALLVLAALLVIFVLHLILS